MQVSGELRQSHKTTLDFDAPSAGATQLRINGNLGVERMLYARTGGPTRPARRVRGDAPAS